MEEGLHRREQIKMEGSQRKKKYKRGKVTMRKLCPSLLCGWRKFG
jgi:hypothetical protein